MTKKERLRRRRDAQRRFVKKHPERRMQISRKHYYGISSVEYDLKKKKQKNRCGLCGKKEKHIDRRTKRPRSLSVDHDHETNRVRDLLCGNCNRGLGLFFDNVELLLKAIQYLKKHKGVQWRIRKKKTQQF